MDGVIVDDVEEEKVKEIVLFRNSVESNRCPLDSPKLSFLYTVRLVVGRLMGVDSSFRVVGVDFFLLS
jgi:hypothetical protein